MKTSHALITPWSLSKGLMTWCCKTPDEVGGDLLATKPEHVTCAGCCASMRTAFENLSAWVPGLKP